MPKGFDISQTSSNSIMQHCNIIIDVPGPWNVHFEHFCYAFGLLHSLGSLRPPPSMPILVPVGSLRMHSHPFPRYFWVRKKKIPKTPNNYLKHLKNIFKPIFRLWDSTLTVCPPSNVTFLRKSLLIFCLVGNSGQCLIVHWGFVC